MREFIGLLTTTIATIVAGLVIMVVTYSFVAVLLEHGFSLADESSTAAASCAAMTTYSLVLLYGLFLRPYHHKLRRWCRRGS